jgi:hypothetical protein
LPTLPAGLRFPDPHALAADDEIQAGLRRGEIPTFDPYYKWLGIPPVEQPPNHYRLLGLAKFETDSDVIQAAADRQMAHVRTYQTGAHAALSQQLLNELAKAKTCLLRADRKAEYDGQLSTSEGKAAIPEEAELADVEIELAPFSNPDRNLAIPLPPHPAVVRRKSKSSLSPLLLVGAVGTVVAVLIVASVFRSPPDVAEKRPGIADERVAKQADDPNKTSHSRPKDPAIAQQLDDVPAKTAHETLETNPADPERTVVGFPIGQWVDVLRLVDTAQNAVEGDWSRTESNIEVAASRHSRITIPVAVDGSYDLEVELNRLEGKGEVRIRIPVGSHACDVEWSRENSTSGIEMLDGLHTIDGKNPTKVSSPDFQNGHVYRLLIMVRLHAAERAAIDVLLDNKPFLPHWEGDPAALTVDGEWKLPTPDHLGLCVWNSTVAFGLARLRMVAGHASSDGAPPSGSEAPAPLQFTKWIYPADESGKPGFFQQRGAEWLEVKAGKVIAHFKQSARTAEFVELFDPGRGLWVRLEPTEYSFSRDRANWFFIAKGAPAAN